MNGTSNLKVGGIVIVLEGLDNLIYEKFLRFEFKATNNKVKYETIIVGMNLTLEMGTSSLMSRSDS